MLVKFPPEILVLKAHKSQAPQGSSRSQAPWEGLALCTEHAAQLWHWTYKDVCVAPSSLRPVLCMLEDCEGPCADTKSFM